MTPERWQQVEQLVNSALKLEENHRADFLKQACGSDEALVREVESLLACESEAKTFIETPALEMVAKEMAGEPERGLVGRQIGAYKITSLLGAGGMGEVYRAEDTRLGRAVAVKVLPEAMAQGKERLSRFVREARAASALNHASVAHIYEIGQSDGVHFIAMEYVEGQSLAKKVSGQPLKLGEIVDIGIQVADALEEAHGKGITHRDIKSANLMITPKGQVKVLDFGLAKIMPPEGVAGSDVSTAIQTAPGRIMGTLQYMSPEQVLLKELDVRTDLFSLGVVLYEMTTGRLPFSASNASEVMDRILHAQPEAIARFNYDVPAEFERIIRKCLEKDRERRYQSSRELLIDLRNHKRDSDPNLVIAEKSQVPSGSRSQTGAAVKVAPQEVKEQLDSGAHVAVKVPQRATQRWLIWSTLALALLTAAGAAVWFNHSGSEAPQQSLAAIPLTTYPGQEQQPSFSPDGNQVAFSWNGEKQDNFDIYVKLVGSGNQLRLTTAPEADTIPAWSPDGRSIAFVREGPGLKAFVYLVSPLGPPERRVAEIGRRVGIGWPRGLAWTPDGKSLVVTDGNSDSEPLGLFLLSVESGEKRRLTSTAEKVFIDSQPAFSPDGRTLAFIREMGLGLCDIYLLTLSEDFQPIGEPKRLTFDNQLTFTPIWTVEGREIIFSSGQLFGPKLFRIAASGFGKPQRLAGVGEDGSEPAISHRTQRLVYTRVLPNANIWRLEVPGPHGKLSSPTKLISSTRFDTHAEFSPDGKRIAFQSNRTGSFEIWICDSDGSNAVPLTSLGGFCGTPRWSPDGERIAFESILEKQWEIYVISANGGKPKRLTTSTPVQGASWSRDGKWIYFGSNRSGEDQVWKIPADGGEAVRVTRKGGVGAFESPDSQWVYYTKIIGDSPLWRVPRDGGEETQVLESVQSQTFALVKEGIYFFTKRPDAAGRYSIQFLNFATKKIRSISMIEGPIDFYLSVSPDGRWILYSQTDQSGSDLMLVENFK